MLLNDNFIFIFLNTPLIVLMVHSLRVVRILRAAPDAAHSQPALYCPFKSGLVTGSRPMRIAKLSEIFMKSNIYESDVKLQ